MALAPIFDTKFYLENNADVAADWGGTALDHYLAWGASEGRAPNGWFDAQYYRAKNPDLQTLTALELFQHYQDFGYAEGRAPSALYEEFDAATYLADYDDLETGGITELTALNHYLAYGIAEGRTAKYEDGTTITPPAAPDPNEGDTIILTSAVGENAIGTSGNDTFRAVLDGTVADGTFNVGDVIDGLQGTDTLNLVLADPLAFGTIALPAGASISNVEIVNLTHTDNPAFAALSSASFAGVEQLWQVDNSLAGPGTFQNVSVAADVTAGFRSTGVAATAVPILANLVSGTSATQKVVSVALDGVGTGSTVDFLAPTGAFQTINLSGSLVGAGNFLSVRTDTVTKTVNAGLTSNTTLGITQGLVDTLQTIDLSDSTGNITLNVSTALFGGVKSVIGGSGNDSLTVDFDNNADGLAVDAGAGNDTVFVLATVAGGATIGDEGAITLGAGKDTVNTGGAGAVTNISAAVIDDDTLVENLITVTDFNTAEDVLDLAGIGFALNSTQLANIDGAATLLAAANGVAAIASGSSAAFSWGGDAYVLTDGDNSGTVNTGDGLIKLTGVDATEFANVQNGNLVL